MAALTTTQTFYETLGVPSSQTSDAIQRAYVLVTMHLRPDVQSSRDHIRALNAAFTVLSDPISRRQYDAVLGGSPCPICRDRITNATEATRHFSEHYDPAVACRVCGRHPARRFRFRANEGWLVQRRVSRSERLLCKSCSLSVYREFQSRNLVRGWWGVISFFATIWYLGSNAVEIAHARSLAPPRPPATEAVERRLRGRPIYRRRAVFGAVVVLLALAGAGVLAVRDGSARAGLSTPSSLSSGQSAGNLGALAGGRSPSGASSVCETRADAGLTEVVDADEAAVDAVNNSRPKIAGSVQLANTGILEAMSAFAGVGPLSPSGIRVAGASKDLLTSDMDVLTDLEGGSTSAADVAAKKSNEIRDRFASLVKSLTALCS